MSDSYIFQRRRIFRRRSTWSSRASLTLIIFLGAMFGYLLPEILSTTSLTPPSLGERAYGQVGTTAPTETASIACEAMDCAGTKAQLDHSSPSASAGQCKITGSCIAVRSGLELAFGADRIEMSVLSSGAR